jgi:S-adenosylmethionine decarboxylase proenzyme
MADVILPNPVFEGSEKRVEIDFALSAGAPSTGLRALSRDQLDELMTLAACTIVSSRSNAYLDAYVLSESSLFVYPTKWVLKTCGTTKLLNAVPRLLELATELGMQPRRCKYSRASFLFPDQQVCAS